MLKLLAFGAATAVTGMNMKLFENLEATSSFIDFIKKYEKDYGMHEILHRYEVFKTNLAKIAEHNAKGESWTMGVTQYADLTEEEFQAMHKGFNHRDSSHYRSLNQHERNRFGTLPDSVNWVEKGAVTPVKNQGQCGSCWAFSTTGSVEGAHFVATGELISLSEQQLVDCAGAEGNQGCQGGLMDDAFQYVMNNKGLAAESEYSYTGKEGTCKNEPSSVTISGFKDVKKGSEDDLLSAVAQQPVSVAVDAGLNWQFYHKGVMKKCKGTQLDHGVLLVGYGTDEETGDDYWLVKNSWGPNWGESGYIRLLRGMDACGISLSASYPVV